MSAISEGDVRICHLGRAEGSAVRGPGSFRNQAGLLDGDLRGLCLRFGDQVAAGASRGFPGGESGLLPSLPHVPVCSRSGYDVSGDLQDSPRPSVQGGKGQADRHPYWTAQFLPERDHTVSHHVEKTKEVLAESVAKHRISDVPRGAFLSSGVDSSSIAALLRRHEEVKTFTVGFDVKGYSE